MDFAIDEFHESIVPMVAVDSLLHEVKRIGDSGQGIVHFMRDTGRQMAERRELLGLGALGFQFLNSRGALLHPML